MCHSTYTLAIKGRPFTNKVLSYTNIPHTLQKLTEATNQQPKTSGIDSRLRLLNHSAFTTTTPRCRTQNPELSSRQERARQQQSAICSIHSQHLEPSPHQDRARHQQSAVYLIRSQYQLRRPREPVKSGKYQSQKPTAVDSTHLRMVTPLPLHTYLIAHLGAGLQNTKSKPRQIGWNSGPAMRKIKQRRKNLGFGISMHPVRRTMSPPTLVQDTYPTLLYKKLSGISC